jgi:photosystem II stability/assembly factor-like uncharacterized protein
MRITTAASSLVFLLTLFFPPLSSAQLHGGGLSVENFSVYSSLPDPSGNRHVAISFAVVNHETLPIAIPRAALVVVGTTSRRIALPNLALGGTAFVSDVFATTALSIAITISIVDNSVVDPGSALARRVAPSRAPAALHAPANAGISVANGTATPAISYTAHLDRPETNRWQSLGPSKILNSGGAPIGVGRVTTLAVDPRSENTVYVGARGSGLWKTTDGGVNWFPIADAFPSAQIDAIAIDPSTPDRILAASPAGIFQSLDAGSVWTRLTAQITAQNRLPWGADGGALIIGTGPVPPLFLSTTTGLVLSINGGFSWSPILGASTIGSLQFDTAGTGLVYASVDGSTSPGTPTGVYMGLNGGLTAASWVQLHGCPGAQLPVIPSQSRVWIAQSGDTKWMSFLASSAQGSGRQLWRTTGVTCPASGYTEDAWKQVPISADCDNLTKDNSSFLYIDPFDTDVVFKSGRRLCRTGNGSSPQWISSVHDDQHAIAFSRSKQTVVYLGNDGGIYRSNDVGQTWNFVGEGLAVSEEMTQDTGSGTPFLVMGTQDNGSASWDGFSPVWNSLDNASPTGDKTLVRLDRSNANLTYQVGQGMPNDVQSYTSLSFQELGDSGKLPGFTCYVEFPIELDCGMAVTGASPSMLIAGDGLWLGSPWTQLLPSIGNVFNRVVSKPSDIFLVGTTDGRIFGGAAPTSLALLFQTPTSAAIAAIAYSSNSTYFIATQTQSGAGRLYRLTCQTSAGAALACTAVDQSPGIPAGEIMSLLVAPNTLDTLLIAMRNAGVYRGVPNGSANTLTWTSLNNGLPAAVTGTNLNAISSSVVFLSTYGRGTFALYPPAPVNPSVTGHVKRFTQERVNPNKPAGALNPLVSTAVMDTSPVDFFSAINLSGSAATILRGAVGTTRRVTITYKPTSGNSGTIVSVH